MATDPKIRYDIAADVSGGDDVEALAQRVEELGESLGGDFKTQADAAATALRELGSKNDAAQNFFDLKKRTEEARVALDDAQKAAQAMGKELAAVEKPTRSQERAFAQLREAVGRANTEYQNTRRALGGARSELDRYGLSVGGLSRQQAELRAELERVSQTATQQMGTMSKAAAGIGQAATAAKNEATGALKDIGTSADTVQQKFTAVTKAVAGLFAAAKLKSYAQDAIATADAFGQMAARVRMSTESQEEFERVQARLLETSNIVSRNLGEQQELFIQTAQVLKGYGKSAEEVMNVTDGFAFLLDRNAASADQARAAINAYSRALNTGKLDSRAWQTIMVSMESVVDDLADSMGIAGEEVRKMAIGGKLAVEDLTRAFAESMEKNKKAAEAMPETVAGSLRRLRNNWGEFLRVANESAGATEKIVGAINALANNLDQVISVAVTAGEVLAVMAGARVLMSLRAYVVELGRANVGTTALTASTTGLTAAIGRAQVAMVGLVQATKGLALAALTVQIAELGFALHGWYKAAQQARESQRQLNETSDQVAQRFAEISKATGVAVASMEELDRAVAEGAIHFDEATATWVAGADTQKEAVEQLAASVARLTENYDEQKKRSEQAIKDAEQELASVKARNEAAIAQARLLNDEAALRDAVSKAAADESSAAQKLEVSHHTLVQTLRDELEQKRELWTASGELTEQQAKQLQELEREIILREQAANAAAKQAAQAVRNADAHSAEALAAGQQLEAARALAITRKADAQATISLLETQKKLAGQTEKLAEMMGDEKKARDARIQQLEIDIKITEAKAAAMRAEAEGTIAVAQATIAELKAKGALTEVKKAELEASIKVAQARLKEADAIKESIKLQEQAIKNAKEYGTALENTAARGVKALGQIRDGWREVGDATDEAKKKAEEAQQAWEEAEARSQARDEARRQGIGAVENAPTAAEAERRARMAAAAAKEEEARAEREEERVRRRDALEASGEAMGGGIQKFEMSDELKQALARFGQPGGLASVVRIEAGRQSYNVDTTTQDGRSQLENLLRDLTDAKRRAA